MGTCYTAGVGIGFVFDECTLGVPFRHDTPETAHFEDRFDPRTGAKIEPAKVIDQYRHTYWVLDGHRYDHWMDLAESINAKVGSELGVIGGLNESKGRKVMFCVNKPYTQEESPSYPFTVYVGEMPATYNYQPALRELQGKLEGLGLKPASPVIRLFCSWG